MLNWHSGRAGQLVDRLVQDGGFQIEHFTAQHLELAREAYARYGKGRNSAGLNYGDCFSYALAKATGLALLFKGSDFAKTDLIAALPNTSVQVRYAYTGQPERDMTLDLYTDAVLKCDVPEHRLKRGISSTRWETLSL